MSLENKKIGLALGGGAVLGSCHIGVLKALEENEITPDYISGTSIGAMVAGFYAFGLDTERIKQIALDLDWLDISGLSISSMGLLTNDKLRDLIIEHLGTVDISDSEIPLRIVASDLSNGEKVVFDKGDLAEAVMASTCIPGIFIPVEKNGKLLVDGGLVENVPVSPLRELGADVIIAVDINALRLYEKPDDIIEVVVNAFDIAMDNLSKPSRDEVDLLIRPELSSYNRTDSGPEKIQEIIDKGYRTASEAIQNYVKKMAND